MGVSDTTEADWEEHYKELLGERKKDSTNYKSKIRKKDLTDYKSRIIVADEIIYNDEYADINNENSQEKTINFLYEIWSDDAYRLIYPALDSLSDSEWVNFYTDINVDGEIRAVYAIDRDNSTEFYEYELNDNEKAMFREKMNEACLKQEGMSLDECLKELREGTYEEDYDDLSNEEI